jgi:hypothetical protein
MFLKDYLAKVTEAINDATQTELVQLSEISTAFRNEKIGLIQGRVVFVDGSTLFFKEYLDVRYRIDKKAYSFHYQDQQSTLRFRYDNANHQPALGFADHKHVKQEILPAELPDTTPNPRHQPLHPRLSRHQLPIAQ